MATAINALGNTDQRALLSAAMAHVYNVEHYGAVADGSTDDQAAIQSAIDAADGNGGGYVILPYSSTSYVIGSALTLYDNVTLDLGGSTLELESGVQHTYMITNEQHAGNHGASISTRNSNITVKNGKVTAPSTTGAVSTSGEGYIHNIVFRGVDNLKLIDIDHDSGTNRKFCVGIGDCARVICENHFFDDTNSDGPHFWAPCNKVLVRNISGTTGDNILALGISDFTTAWTVPDGDIDNFTNFTLDGLVLTDIAFSPVRIYGLSANKETDAGGTQLHEQYYFDNILLKNVSGNITTSSSGPLNLGYGVGGTWIKNLTAEDWVLDNDGSFPQIDIQGNDQSTIERLVVRNFVSDYAGTAEFLKVSDNTVVNEIILDGINVTYPAGNTTAEHIEFDARVDKLTVMNSAFYNGLTWFKHGSSAPNWTEYTDNSVAYASGTTFTVTGVDVSDADFKVGTRVQVVGTTTGTIWGTVTDSVFSTDTTVTVSFDEASDAIANESLTISIAHMTEIFLSNVYVECHKRGILVSRTLRVTCSGVVYLCQDQDSGNAFIYGFQNTGEHIFVYGDINQIPNSGTDAALAVEFVAARGRCSDLRGHLVANATYVKPTAGNYFLQRNTSVGAISANSPVVCSGTQHIDVVDGGTYTP